MRFKHHLLYTSLFLSTAVLAEQNASLTDVVVNGENATDLIEGSYQSRHSNIANKGLTPLLDSPQTVNVVNAQLIQDRKPQNIDDALATVSGVAQANNLGGLFDAVLKRGFGKNRDNSIIRNGLPSGPSHNFSATTERVEVLKGPASVLYGIQDPGGVINVVTKQPLPQPRYVVGGQWGSRGLWGTSLDFSSPLGNGVAYRLIVDKHAKSYWRNFGEIARTTYAPSIAWQNERSKLSLSYEHLDYHEPFDRGTLMIASGKDHGKIVPVSAKTRLDDPTNQITGKVDHLEIKAEHRLHPNWVLKGAYGYTREHYHYWQTRVQAVDLASGFANRRLEGIRNANQKIHAGSLSVLGEFATGEIAHRLAVGLDLSRNYRDIYPRVESNDNLKLSLSQPRYLTAVPNVWQIAAHNAQQTDHLKTVGVYLQDTAYLNEHWILAAGLRYEYYDQLAGRGGRTTAFKANTNQHAGKWLYQGGVVYKIHPDWSLYSNYAESFRPQSQIAAEVRHDLKPEWGRSFEFGTKYENSQFSTNVALFHILKKNVAHTANNQTYLKGKVRSQGLEWDIHGKLSEKWGVTASYAYTQTRILQDNEYPALVGQRFDGVPTHQGNLFVTYDLGQLTHGHWRMGAGARYLGSWSVSNTHRSVAGQGVRYKLPHAIVSEAFVAFDTQLGGRRLSVQLNGKNLTNKTYYTSTVGTNNNVIPLQLGYGREWVLNTQLTF